jgi:hypothetical protein
MRMRMTPIDFEVPRSKILKARPHLAAAVLLQIDHKLTVYQPNRVIPHGSRMFPIDFKVTGQRSRSPDKIVIDWTGYIFIQIFLSGIL